MGNGVEVIVKEANKTVAIGLEKTPIHPFPVTPHAITLPPYTVSRQFHLIDHPNKLNNAIDHLLHSIVRSISPDLITKTLLTTFTFYSTILNDKNTIVNSHEETISNIVTQKFQSTIEYTPRIQETSTISPELLLDSFNSYYTNTMTTTYIYYNTFTADSIPIVVTRTELVSNVVTIPGYLVPPSPQQVQVQLTSPLPPPPGITNDHHQSSSSSSSNLISSYDFPSYSRVIETETYFTTLLFSKTIFDNENNDNIGPITSKILTTQEILTQVVVTEVLIPVGEQTTIESTATITMMPINPLIQPTKIEKTYYTTFTHFSTILNGTNSITESSIHLISNIITETFEPTPILPPEISSIQSSPIISALPIPMFSSFSSLYGSSALPIPSPEIETFLSIATERSTKINNNNTQHNNNNHQPQPVLIYATKTYYTTFTFFTSILGAIATDGDGLSTRDTKIQSRTQIVSRITTEALATELNAAYLNILKQSYLSQHSTLLEVTSSIHEIIPTRTIEGSYVPDDDYISTSIIWPHWPKDEEQAILDPIYKGNGNGNGGILSSIIIEPILEHKDFEDTMSSEIRHVVNVLTDTVTPNPEPQISPTAPFPSGAAYSTATSTDDSIISYEEITLKSPEEEVNDDLIAEGPITSPSSDIDDDYISSVSTFGTHLLPTPPLSISAGGIDPLINEQLASISAIIQSHQQQSISMSSSSSSTSSKENESNESSSSSSSDEDDEDIPDFPDEADIPFDLDGNIYNEMNIGDISSLVDLYVSSKYFKSKLTSSGAISDSASNSFSFQVEETPTAFISSLVEDSLMFLKKTGLSPIYDYDSSSAFIFTPSSSKINDNSDLFNDHSYEPLMSPVFKPVKIHYSFSYPNKVIQSHVFDLLSELSSTDDLGHHNGQKITTNNPSDYSDELNKEEELDDEFKENEHDDLDTTKIYSLGPVGEEVELSTTTTTTESNWNKLQDDEQQYQQVTDSIENEAETETETTTKKKVTSGIIQRPFAEEPEPATYNENEIESTTKDDDLYTTTIIGNNLHYNDHDDDNVEEDPQDAAAIEMPPIGESNIGNSDEEIMTVIKFNPNGAPNHTQIKFPTTNVNDDVSTTLTSSSAPIAIASVTKIRKPIINFQPNNNKPAPTLPPPPTTKQSKLKSTTESNDEYDELEDNNNNNEDVTKIYNLYIKGSNGDKSTDSEDDIDDDDNNDNSEGDELKEDEGNKKKKKIKKKPENDDSGEDTDTDDEEEGEDHHNSERRPPTMFSGPPIMNLPSGPHDNNNNNNNGLTNLGTTGANNNANAGGIVSTAAGTGINWKPLINLGAIGLGGLGASTLTKLSPLLTSMAGYLKHGFSPVIARNDTQQHGVGGGGHYYKEKPFIRYPNYEGTVGQFNKEHNIIPLGNNAGHGQQQQQHHHLAAASGNHHHQRPTQLLRKPDDSIPRRPILSPASNEPHFQNNNNNNNKNRRPFPSNSNFKPPNDKQPNIYSISNHNKAVPSSHIVKVQQGPIIRPFHNILRPGSDEKVNNKRQPTFIRQEGPPPTSFHNGIMLPMPPPMHSQEQNHNQQQQQHQQEFDDSIEDNKSQATSQEQRPLDLHNHPHHNLFRPALPTVTEFHQINRPSSLPRPRPQLPSTAPSPSQNSNEQNHHHQIRNEEASGEENLLFPPRHRTPSSDINPTSSKETQMEAQESTSSEERLRWPKPPSPTVQDTSLFHNSDERPNNGNNNNNNNPFNQQTRNKIIVHGSPSASDEMNEAQYHQATGNTNAFNFVISEQIPVQSHEESNLIRIPSSSQTPINFQNHGHGQENHQGQGSVTRLRNPPGPLMMNQRPTIIQHQLQAMVPHYSQQHPNFVQNQMFQGQHQQIPIRPIIHPNHQGEQQNSEEIKIRRPPDQNMGSPFMRPVHMPEIPAVNIDHQPFRPIEQSSPRPFMQPPPPPQQHFNEIRPPSHPQPQLTHFQPNPSPSLIPFDFVSTSSQRPVATNNHNNLLRPPPSDSRPQQSQSSNHEPQQPHHGPSVLLPGLQQIPPWPSGIASNELPEIPLHETHGEKIQDQLPQPLLPGFFSPTPHLPPFQQRPSTVFIVQETYDPPPPAEEPTQQQQQSSEEKINSSNDEENQIGHNNLNVSPMYSQEESHHSPHSTHRPTQQLVINEILPPQQKSTTARVHPAFIRHKHSTTTSSPLDFNDNDSDHFGNSHSSVGGFIISPTIPETFDSSSSPASSSIQDQDDHTIYHNMSFSSTTTPNSISSHAPFLNLDKYFTHSGGVGDGDHEVGHSSSGSEDSVSVLDPSNHQIIKSPFSSTTTERFNNNDNGKRVPDENDDEEDTLLNAFTIPDGFFAGSPSLNDDNNDAVGSKEKDVWWATTFKPNFSIPFSTTPNHLVWNEIFSSTQEPLSSSDEQQPTTYRNVLRPTTFRPNFRPRPNNNNMIRNPLHNRPLLSSASNHHHHHAQSVVNTFYDDEEGLENIKLKNVEIHKKPEFAKRPTGPGFDNNQHPVLAFLPAASEEEDGGSQKNSQDEEGGFKKPFYSLEDSDIDGDLVKHKRKPGINQQQQQTQHHNQDDPVYSESDEHKNDGKQNEDETNETYELGPPGYPMTRLRPPMPPPQQHGPFFDNNVNSQNPRRPVLRPVVPPNQPQPQSHQHPPPQSQRPGPFDAFTNIFRRPTRPNTNEHHQRPVQGDRRPGPQISDSINILRRPPPPPLPTQDHHLANDISFGKPHLNPESSFNKIRPIPLNPAANNGENEHKINEDNYKIRRPILPPITRPLPEQEPHEIPETNLIRRPEGGAGQGFRRRPVIHQQQQHGHGNLLRPQHPHNQGELGRPHQPQLVRPQQHQHQGEITRPHQQNIIRQPPLRRPAAGSIENFRRPIHTISQQENNIAEVHHHDSEEIPNEESAQDIANHEESERPKIVQNTLPSSTTTTKTSHQDFNIENDEENDNSIEETFKPATEVKVSQENSHKDDVDIDNDEVASKEEEFGSLKVGNNNRPIHFGGNMFNSFNNRPHQRPHPKQRIRKPKPFPPKAAGTIVVDSANGPPPSEQPTSSIEIHELVNQHPPLKTEMEPPPIDSLKQKPSIAEFPTVPPRRFRRPLRPQQHHQQPGSSVENNNNHHQQRPNNNNNNNNNNNGVHRYRQRPNLLRPEQNILNKRPNLVRPRPTFHTIASVDEDNKIIATNVVPMIHNHHYYTKQNEQNNKNNRPDSPEEEENDEPEEFRPSSSTSRIQPTRIADISEKVTSTSTFGSNEPLDNPPQLSSSLPDSDEIALDSSEGGSHGSSVVRYTGGILKTVNVQHHDDEESEENDHDHDQDNHPEVSSSSSSNTIRGFQRTRFRVSSVVQPNQIKTGEISPTKTVGGFTPINVASSTTTKTQFPFPGRRPFTRPPLSTNPTTPTPTESSSSNSSPKNILSRRPFIPTRSPTSNNFLPWNRRTSTTSKPDHETDDDEDNDENDSSSNEVLGEDKAKTKVITTSTSSSTTSSSSSAVGNPTIKNRNTIVPFKYNRTRPNFFNTKTTVISAESSSTKTTTEINTANESIESSSIHPIEHPPTIPDSNDLKFKPTTFRPLIRPTMFTNHHNNNNRIPNGTTTLVVSSSSSSSSTERIEPIVGIKTSTHVSIHETSSSEEEKEQEQEEDAQENEVETKKTEVLTKNGTISIVTSNTNANTNANNIKTNQQPKINPSRPSQGPTTTNTQGKVSIITSISSTERTEEKIVEDKKKKIPVISETTRYVTHTETTTQIITETETTVLAASAMNQNPITHTIMITKTLPPQTLISTIIGSVTLVNSVDVKPTTVRSTIYSEATKAVYGDNSAEFDNNVRKTVEEKILNGNIGSTSTIITTSDPIIDSSSTLISITSKESSSSSSDIVPKKKIRPYLIEPGCQTHNCSTQGNHLCKVFGNGTSKCICAPGFARAKTNAPCRPTFTYEMNFVINHMDGVSFNYKDLKNDGSDAYLKFIELTKDALDKIFLATIITRDFQGTEIMKVDPRIVKNDETHTIEPKVNVDFLVQLRKNMTIDKIKNYLIRTLRASNFTMGKSGIILSSNNISDFSARDFNECAIPDFNDCGENAECVNVPGSYRCQCLIGFKDRSRRRKPGRECIEMAGCAECNYRGNCYANRIGQTACNCFRWYGGAQCNIDLKILLMSIIGIVGVLFIFVLLCGVLMCRKKKRNPGRVLTRPGSGRFMRYRSPTSQAQLERAAIMHDSASSVSDGSRTPPVRSSGHHHGHGHGQSHGHGHHHPQSPQQHSFTPDSLLIDSDDSKNSIGRHGGRRDTDLMNFSLRNVVMDQQDRSLTVVIPRAKIRPSSRPSSRPNTSAALGPDVNSDLAAAESKLMSFLDPGSKPVPPPPPKMPGESSRHSTAQKNKEAKARKLSLQERRISTGALVSSGTEVSARGGMRRRSTGLEPDIPIRYENRTVSSDMRSYDETTVRSHARPLFSSETSRTSCYSCKPPSYCAYSESATTGHMAEKDGASTVYTTQGKLFRLSPDTDSNLSSD